MAEYASLRSAIPPYTRAMCRSGFAGNYDFTGCIKLATEDQSLSEKFSHLCYNFIMMKKPSPKSRAKASKVIGFARFEKISAVEGIVLTKDMKRRRAEFEQTGASAAKRRAAIISAYKR
jgi:hypothetical protein